MSGSTAYRFRWISSFMDCVDYEVFGDGEKYRVEVRRGTTEYEREHYAGSEERWQREVIPTINGIRRCGRPTLAIPDAVVDAFNAWRQAEHEEVLASIESNPERYGVLTPDDPLRAPPVAVRGLVLNAENGWSVSRDWPQRKENAAA
jgi:hypothetical protein